VQTRRAELVSLLLDKGADATVKDSEGRTPMGALIATGGSEDAAPIVTLLLAKGADPNERIYSEPILNRAISNDSKEVVRALLASKKVNLKASSERQSPLMLALNFGRNEIVGMLLDAGADPNEKDSQGRTALKIASDRSKELGDLLRAKGAKDG
jgi:ankyrin repeat protein